MAATGAEPLHPIPCCRGCQRLERYPAQRIRSRVLLVTSPYNSESRFNAFLDHRDVT